MTTETSFEILTVDQFAERMKVCRTTIFQWIKDNILVQGEHFFKHKRVVLFIWCKEIIISLAKNSAKIEKNSPEKTIVEKVKDKHSQKVRINFDLRWSFIDNSKFICIWFKNLIIWIEKKQKLTKWRRMKWWKILLKCKEAL